MKNDTTITRRRFLRHGSTAAGLLIAAPSVLGARGRKKGAPPSHGLNIAGIGLGARGLGNMKKCEGAKIAALCDVDWRQAATAFREYPDAAKYKDCRKMFDREKDIDAVVISTPDHTHAVIAAEAMKRGKHVFVETPLAHDVWEARELARIARENKVVTQMGNERHSGPGIRRTVELLWGGGLGPIGEVHCWTNRPQWPQGVQRPPEKATGPQGIDWNCWLGPAARRAYDPAYHPYRWRGWVDFGTGALGAMGCHLLDAAFWGLKLAGAKSFTIEAESTGVKDGSYPTASTIRYRFPARGGEPPLTVTWHDGGRRPKAPENLPYLREIGSNGSLFVGEEHCMMFGPTVFGTNPGQIGPRVIPEFTKVESRKKFERIPAVRETSWQKGNRHIQEWLSACKTGKQPCANFDVSAPLAEMVLLGNVALLAGKPIEWDSEKLRITNDAGANRFVRREYREGWGL